MAYYVIFGTFYLSMYLFFIIFINMNILSRILTVTILAGFTIGTYAAPPSTKTAKLPFEFDLEARALVGDYINYGNFNFNMPMASLDLDAQIRWRIDRENDFKAKYKAEIIKAFTSYSTSGLFMDTYEQQLDLDLFYRKKGLRIDTFFDYTWKLRPQWPDFYQTNVVGTTLVFTPTDRFTYHKLNPGVKGKFALDKEWDLLAKAEYEAKISTIDPNWTPTHVTPRGYNAYGAEVGVDYSPEGESYSIELSNHFERKHFTHLPSRNAISGGTSGGTNPLYVAWSNTTELKADFEINSINMTITPRYAIEFYTDEFEGYYSYIGHKFGLDVKQSLFNGAFEYEIGGKFKTLGYGPNSKDPANLTDGKPLYKNYILADVELLYHFNQNFSIFIEGDLFIKQSNYPDSLQSGVTPEDDILFNYDNFYIGSGVEYRL